MVDKLKKIYYLLAYVNNEKIGAIIFPRKCFLKEFRSKFCRKEFEENEKLDSYDRRID